MACPFGFSRAQPAEPKSVLCSALQHAAPAAGIGPASVAGAPAFQPPAATTTVGSCPLGYSRSSSGPALSELHCMLCKSLLHAATRIQPCNHVFCRGCMERFRDCPRCGVDVEGLEPDNSIQRTVDAMLQVHGSQPQLLEGKVDIGPLVDHTPAALFLALGLRAYTAGNMPAALDRLQRCKQELLLQQSVRTEQGTPAPERHSCDPGPFPADISCGGTVACRLGAVCGSIGDCWRVLGDVPKASAAYEESVAALRGPAEEDMEAACALSVTLNKLGDLRYGTDLHAAACLYEESVKLRERIVGPCNSGKAGPAEQLALAGALIKLGDAREALGHVEEAQTHFHMAHGRLQELKEAADALDQAGRGRLQACLDIVSLRCHHRGGNTV